MAVTFLGLTIGDDGTGYRKPTYEGFRAAFAQYWQDLKGLANLATNPGDFFGHFVDAGTQVFDLGMQADVDVVARTLFVSAQDVSLDQLLQDITTRVLATASRAREVAYGTPGSAVPLGTFVRATAGGLAWNFTTGGVVPAAPATAYVLEVDTFSPGAFVGQAFTLTIGGVPATIISQPGDDGVDVRDALVVRVNDPNLAISPVAYRLGTNPVNGRPRLLVIDESGGGPFAFVATTPAGSTFDFPAFQDVVQASVAGPTAANAQVLVFGQALAGVQGYGNWLPATPGRTRETDSQLRARHLVNQRGMGGGNPDAVRAIQLSPVDLGGGGALFCSVEYNPDDVTDDVGNVPHSVRVVVESTVDVDASALALWKAKAAGDDMNGDVLVVIQDAEGANQNVLIDFLEEVWLAVEIHYVVGEGWPNTGDPEAQMRADVAAFVEALAAAKDVRVNELPIAFKPDGTPRGVANFTVRLATGAAPGGPFGPFGPFWPTNPDANSSSVVISGRQKARCDVADVSAGP